MTTYYHLSPEERAVIMIERSNHSSIRKIARTLNRSASTISRELQRNSVSTEAVYCAKSARQRYDKRRESCMKPVKLAVGSYLYNAVKDCLLEKQWSPELVSGALKKQHDQWGQTRLIFNLTVKLLFKAPRDQWGQTEPPPV